MIFLQNVLAILWLLTRIAGCFTLLVLAVLVAVGVVRYSSNS